MPPVTPGKEWEHIESVVDSGGAIPVLPPDATGEHATQESPASKRGVQYEDASGNWIPNLGEKFVPVVTSEGTVRGYHTQIADVSKPLSSVRSMNKAHQTVVFDEDGSFIFNKVSGELNWLRDDGTNFLLDMWVMPKVEIEKQLNEGQSQSHFRRQQNP